MKFWVTVLTEIGIILLASREQFGSSATQYEDTFEFARLSTWEDQFQHLWTVLFRVTGR